MSALINDRYSFGIGSSPYNLRYFTAKSFHQGWESLASEDSGRTLDGIMRIYWVRTDIKKFEIVMPPCTYEVIRDIVNIVQGKEYYIQVWDPSIGGVANYHVYTSNSKTDMYSGVVHNGLYENFEFHAIEL